MVYLLTSVVLFIGIWLGYNYRNEIYKIFHYKEMEEKTRKKRIANEKRRITILKKKGLYDKAKIINEK